MSVLFPPSEADDLRKRELPRATVKATLADLQGAILFGAGRISRALLPRLKQQGIKPAWFVDNNSALWGQKLDGIEIRSATSLSEAGDRLVLIMTTYAMQMANACHNACVKRWSWFTDIEEVFGACSITTSAEHVLSNTDIDRLSSILEGSEKSIAVLKHALMFCVTCHSTRLVSTLPKIWYRGISTGISLIVVHTTATPFENGSRGKLTSFLPVISNIMRSNLTLIIILC